MLNIYTVAHLVKKKQMQFPILTQKSSPMKHKQLKRKLIQVYSLILGLLTLASYSQTYCSGSSCDLVCNGSFENFSPVPQQYADPIYYTQTIPFATNWMWFSTGTGTDPVGSPDLFTNQSPTSPQNKSVYIPCNFAGYQYAHTGNAYAGLLTMWPSGPIHSMQNTEFIVNTFSSALITGKIYEVSLWLSRADFSNHTITGLGVWVNNTGDNSGSAAYNCPVSLLNNDAWTQVKFSYCAQGGESYIVIGGNTTVQGNTITPTSYTNCSSVASQSDYYIYIDDVSVKEAKFTVNVPSVNCINSPVNVSLNSACVANMSDYTYTWNFGDGTSSNTGTVSSSSHSYTNSANYTNTVSVSNGSCSVTYTYNVNIPALSVSVSSNTNTICDGSVNLTATPNPGGSIVYGYNWVVTDAATATVVSVPGTNTTTASPSLNFSGIYQNVNICCTITNPSGCQATQCIYLPSCCQTPTSTIKYSNTTFSTNTTLTGSSTQKYQFGGSITVNSGVTLNINTAEVIMDPNTKFTILGNGALKINSSYLHACNAMWNGIYPMGTSTFSLTNSRLEDAQRVVIDSLGGAIIVLTGNYFNKNYKDVHLLAAKTSTASFTAKNNLFTCSNIAPPTWPNYVPLIPNKINASTFGSYASVNLMAPYSTLKTQAGIQLNAASQIGATNTAITIGGNATEENVFDKIGEGIISMASYMLVQNNVFQNIQSSLVPISGTPNAGVWIFNINWTSTNYNSQIGGTTSQRNTFINNDNGVYDNGRQTLLVANNTFSTQTTGVTVANNNNGHTVSTNNNNFYDNLTGIYYYNNTKITANVNDNNFTNTSAIGTNWTNKAIVCNEVTLATNPLNYPAYTVYNNNIVGFYRGIETTNTLNAYIYDNEVHMRQDNTSDHWQFGIEFNGTNNCQVNNNTIDMNGSSRNQWAYWQNAIEGNSNQVPKIQCNSTNKVCMAMQIQGSNVTAAGNGIMGNYMQDASYGVWLNNNGEIGDQYTTNTSTSADNSWATTVDWYTYTQSNSNTVLNARFYTRSTAPFDLPAIKTMNNGISLLLSGTNNSAAAGGVCNNNTPTPSNLRSSAPLNLMQNADAVAGDFANDLSVMGNLNSQSLDAENDEDINQKAINRYHLWRNLKLQQIEVNDMPALNSFMGAAKEQNTGLLWTVDSLLHLAETDSSYINLAAQANNVIAPANAVEQNHQDFNNLYISYLQQDKKLDNIQTQQMESIATLCPANQGNSVLQARALLYYLTRKSYLSLCEQTAPANMVSSARKGLGKEMEARNNISVYPNPGDDFLYVEAKDYAGLSIQLYDMLGGLVLEQNIVPGQTLNTAKLAAGIYTYKVYQYNSEQKIGKLVISH